MVQFARWSSRPRSRLQGDQPRAGDLGQSVNFYADSAVDYWILTLGLNKRSQKKTRNAQFAMSGQEEKKSTALCLSLRASFK